MNLKELTIVGALDLLKSKKITAVELTKAYISSIETNKLNAYITSNFEESLKRAEESDERYKNNQNRELEGIVIAVKDLFCTKNLRTTCASRMLENFIPGYESTVTQKLLDAGAIIIGKTNMDEFAMGSSNETSYFGPSINPYKSKSSPNEDLVPGGSSGGSAVAVAADLCLASIGSDTGGSIRQPASLTNIVGIKPTYGRCSRHGMIAFASSLDQAGVFAKNVEDAALVQKVISGYDENDSTSCAIPVPDFSKLLNHDLTGKKIGIPKEYFLASLPVDIARIWDMGKKIIEDNGGEIVEISLPHTKYAPSVYYVIAPAECSSNLARFDGIRYGYSYKNASNEKLTLEEMYEKTRSIGFGAEVKRRILTGTFVLSSEHYDSYYKKAQKIRRLVTQDFLNAFKEVDAILTPSTPRSAFAVGSSIKNQDPTVMYLNDIFTIPVNLAGLPAMSVPAGFDTNDLPIGLQIISKHFDEQTMLDVAFAIENAQK